mgnify:CR=1 FL=1|jgi:hypothetical protein
MAFCFCAAGSYHKVVVETKNALQNVEHLSGPQVDLNYYFVMNFRSIYIPVSVCQLTEESSATVGTTFCTAFAMHKMLIIIIFRLYNDNYLSFIF